MKDPKPTSSGTGKSDGWSVVIILLVLALTGGLIIVEGGYFRHAINVSLPKVDTRK